MKKYTLGIVIAFLLGQAAITTEASAVEIINISGWEIEIQTDGTCALGKLYEFGARDAVNIAITSYGSISFLSDKDFTGDITVDGNKAVHPVNAISHTMYMYSNSDNKENGKLLIKYFKRGSFAKITTKKGKVRALSLKGFTKAYKRYEKCDR